MPDRIAAGVVTDRCRLLTLIIPMLALVSCAPGVWLGKSTVRIETRRATEYLPRLFAPLRPGSVYPDRRVPVPVDGRPGVVLVAERASVLSNMRLRPFGERGLVVVSLVLDLQMSTSTSAIDEAGRWLQEQRACRAAPIALVLVEPSEALARAALVSPRFARVVLVEPPALPSEVAAGRVLVLRRLSDGEVPSASADGKEAQAGTPIHKWYRVATRARSLPDEAFRDAAEWLSEEFRAWAPVTRGDGQSRAAETP